MKVLSRVLKIINVVKTYAAENIVKNDFVKICFEKYKLEMKKTKITSLHDVFIDIILDIPVVLLFILGAFLFQVEGISVATLMLFLMLLNNITVPFTSFGSIYIQYKQTKVSVDRLKTILDNDREEETGTSLNSPIESLRFEDTGFKYNEKTVFHAFNLLLSTGKYYATIGENDSGKYTFIKLLLNLYSPESGSLSANGIDYKNLDFKESRKDKRLYT
jgi:ABC-type bacteriocin/lantibiotic exporter with double-glycine peptidase domain